MVEVTPVLGTYNRKASLQRCVESIRRSVGALTYRCVIVDGGSTDGSSEWLAQQPDVELIQQELPLKGCVPSFNEGFARAVEMGAPFVGVMNDDIWFTGSRNEIEESVNILRGDINCGAVAFNSDRYGEWRHERYHGLVYMNQGIVRREAGMAVARAQGDPTGCAWWCRDHLAYAADTEFGFWLRRLGWNIHEAVDLRVHDTYLEDGGSEEPLRKHCLEQYTTIDKFMARWKDPASVNYNREDAARFGGRVR